jgi:stage V sporulation protein M
MLDEQCKMVRRDNMKFYTIKLPRFLGGLVRAMIGAFKKND